MGQQDPNDELPTAKGEKKMTRAEHANEIENRRTILGLYGASFNDKELPKYVLGLIFYVVIFVVFIPYLMLHNNVSEEIFLAYVPNVDILATVLGYEGGPFSNIWRYLYNPSNLTLFGFFSTTLMNYFALLGATFMVAWQTHKHKSWKRGWSAAFIFLLCTYLLPGNPIVILQNNVAAYLNGSWGIGSNEPHLRYALIVAVGLILTVCIILVESFLIKSTRHHIEHGIHLAHNAVKYHFKM
jgi:hypothetical protein